MDSQQLARYLAGEASSAERAQVEAWVAADGQRQQELSHLEKAWAGTTEPGTWDVDQAWSRVRGRLDSAVAEPAAPPIAAIGRRALPWLAAAAVVAAVGFGVNRAFRQPVYATAIGEQRNLVLSDGSRVTLAPASRLVVARGFGSTVRRVTLSGKALFEVTHDDDHPFQVAAGGMMIEDLGTEFEVSATAAETRIAVRAGSVAVHSMAGGARMTLGPNDLVSVTAEGAPSLSHRVAVDRIMMWRRGRLAFDSRPLSEVLAELARWHDVSFEAAPDILAQRFNGELVASDLDRSLDVLTATLGLTRSTSGRTINLVRKAAP